MEKLLVTTDFSTNSKAGIRFALQLQSQSNCSLVFYHAISVSKPTSWSDKKYKSFQTEKIDENLKNLEDFVTDICKQSGFKTVNCDYVAETGTETDEMIIRYAKKTKADFICLSTHGAGRIRKILGTNASELITTSPIPVIVVPKSYKTQTITNVFYASDFSSLDKELKAISTFTIPLHLKVDVFHYDYLLHVPENKVKLEKKAAKYQNAELNFHFKRQEIELPLSEHLRKEIKKEKPSMVILFTKQNRNWYDRLFLSSESADMAFNAQVPLLVFRKNKSMKNLLSCLLVLFSLTAVFSQNGNGGATPQNTDPKNLSMSQYNERIAASTKLVLVYFKADWCIVCKKQKPLLESVMADHKSTVELLEINMEDNPLIAEYFEVDGLPVTILYKHGKIVWDRMGLTDKSELEAQIHFFEK